MRPAVLVLCFAAGLAHAAQWIPFRLCKHADGMPADTVSVEGMPTANIAWIRTNTVLMVIPHARFGNCSMIKLTNGDQAFVIGSADEIQCKVTGGWRCVGGSNGGNVLDERR